MRLFQNIGRILIIYKFIIYSMNQNKYILIPLGGIGNRFKKDNFKSPKALITVNNKCIIYWLLDNLEIPTNYTILIPYNKAEYELFDLENKIRNRYTKIKFKFYPLEKTTKGAVETINICLQNFSMDLSCYPVLSPHQALKYHDGPILCIDSDNFYLQNIIEEWNGENKIFVFKDTQSNPIFSYVKKDDNNKILEIIEKEKISNLACCGAYGFNKPVEFIKSAKKLLKISNDVYISHIILDMILNGKNFNIISTRFRG